MTDVEFGEEIGRGCEGLPHNGLPQPMEAYLLSLLDDQGDGWPTKTRLSTCPSRSFVLFHAVCEELVRSESSFASLEALASTPPDVTVCHLDLQCPNRPKDQTPREIFELLHSSNLGKKNEVEVTIPAHTERVRMSLNALRPDW